jgi:hypothetical protein
VEALEARQVLSSVSFSVGAEIVDAGAGTFSVAVTLSGAPTPTVATVASGLSAPDAVAFDSSGNLYVANFLSGTVSEQTPAGVVSAFASGLDGPEALAFDASGDLFVADALDNTAAIPGVPSMSRRVFPILTPVWPWSSLKPPRGDRREVLPWPDPDRLTPLDESSRAPFHPNDALRTRHELIA